VSSETLSWRPLPNLHCCRERAPADCFAIILGGGKHNVITQPSLVHTILNLRTEVSSKEFMYYMMEKLWNDHKTSRTVNPDDLWGPIHKALNTLSREPFLSKAVAATVKAVEENTYNLVSSNSSWVDQSVWERSSRITILPGHDAVVEVSLFPLIRDFMGDNATRVLMGKNFMDNYPEFLQDLWDTDDKFILFVLGVPGWLPGMTKADMARERVIEAVTEHHEALFALFDGKDPGSKWDDMSDVSNAAIERCKAFKAANAPRRILGCGGAALVWVMNVNASPVSYFTLSI